MKIAILSDAHGNDIGTNLCFEYLKDKNIDRYIFLGDIGDYIPYAKNVFNILQKNSCSFVLGNHDEVLFNLNSSYYLSDVFKTGNTVSDLGEDNINIIKKYPKEMELKTENWKKILFIHIGLDAYYSEKYLVENSTNIYYDYIFCGHTHRPKLYTLKDNKKIINVGSCGLPRDYGNLLSFVTFDTITENIEFHKVEFDTDSFIKENAEKLHPYVIECFNKRGE